MRHSGKTYHEFILGSPRDRRVRERFRQLVFGTMPPHGTILDFGAGTGIDAARYAANGLKVLVHEPSEANLAHLREHCRQQIEDGSVSIADLSVPQRVDMIVANFAVLNLIADHRTLFEKFAALLAPRGLVLVSVLNPFFLGDIRYSWWWQHLYALIRHGAYAFNGESGPIYRFAPSFLSRAAQPYFRLARSVPGRIRFLASQYVFVLLQKQ